MEQKTTISKKEAKRIKEDLEHLITGLSHLSALDIIKRGSEVAKERDFERAIDFRCRVRGKAEHFLKMYDRAKLLEVGLSVNIKARKEKEGPTTTNKEVKNEASQV